MIPSFATLLLVALLVMKDEKIYKRNMIKTHYLFKKDGYVLLMSILARLYVPAPVLTFQP
ncbi:MAG: hypothetical protein QM791_04725 [Ferruginibacter sp.]